MLITAGANAQVFVWSGTGAWSSAGNWSTNTVPGANDTAQVPSGALAVSDTRAIGTLTFSGGTLGGSGALTAGTFSQSAGSLSLAALSLAGSSSSWSGGDWNGAGTTTVTSSGSLTISSGSDHDFSSRTLTNSGIIAWTGGRLRSGNGGAIVNNATWNDSASSVFNNDFGGTALTFTNSATGTYNKTASGTTRFDVPFNNAGNVSVTGGTLQLNGGGSSSGAFSTGASGSVLFSHDYTITDGSTLLGTGGYQVTGGYFALNGHVTLANFQFSGGSLGGDHTLSGALTWNGGDMNNISTTTIAGNGTLNIAGNVDHDFSLHQFINNGTVNWQAGAGRLRAGNLATFTNNAIFNDAASNVVNKDYGNTWVFTNSTSGTYNKTAAGTTRFDTTFNNDGTVNVTAGTLQFNGGGTNSAKGILNTNSGASVVFSSDYTLENGSSLTGAGSFALTGGTLVISGSASVSNLAISGGVLGGTHTLSGSIVWNGGNLNALGQTTTIAANGTLNIAGNVDHDFSLRYIVNQGAVNWQSGAGRLRSGFGMDFTNNGIFNDAASSVMNSDYGAGGSRPGLIFINSTSGAYNKTAAGTTRFDVPFNNDGTVNVSAGTLQLNGGGINSATGVLNTSAGASVVFSSDYTLANASSLTGAGSFVLTGGVLTANGSATISSFSISGGLLDGTHTLTGAIVWNGGALAHGGTTTLGASSTFTLSGNFDHDMPSRNVVNNGTMTWAAGSGRVRSGNNGGITNNGTFIDVASSAMNNDYGGPTSAFTNAATGTYNKTAGASTYFIPFNNNGAVNVSTGASLDLRGGGTNSATGSITAASGATVVFNNDYTLANASSLGGAGAFSVGAGTLNATGNVNVGNFAFNGGALAGTQTFNGGLNWSAGNFSTGGITTIAPNSNFTINTVNDHDFNTRAIVNNGTTTWSGGRLRSGNGGTFTNNSLFIDQASSHVNNDYGGTALIFTNSAGATYRKTATGQTTVFVPFVNSGILDLQAGILGLTTTSTFNDGASMVGAGLLQLISGTLTANGTMSFSNFELVGGTIAGTHLFGGHSHITWTAGNFNGGGTTTFGGTIDISSGNDHDFNSHAFVNNLTVNWTGGRIRSGNGGLFTNYGVFNDSAGAQFNNDYGGATAGFVNDLGIYNKSGAGTTLFNNVSFANTGIVNISGGVLNLGGGGSSATGALFTTAVGTALQFTAGSFAIANGQSFAGNGTFAVAGATVTLGGTVGVSDFQLNSGTLAGTQTFNGGLLWSAGNMNASGTTTIGPAGAFTISTTNDHDFNGHAFVNNGEVRWDAGRLRSGNGGSIVNNGIWQELGSSNLNNDYGGTTATFTNTGQYIKAGGNGVTTIDIPFVNNGGNVESINGTLNFRGSFTSSGGIVLLTQLFSLAPPTIQFSGPVSLASTALAGNGTVVASSITAGRAVSPGNAIGTLALTGNLTLLSTNQLIIELGGAIQGGNGISQTDNYDFLSVAGSALLDGTLKLSFFNQFQTTVLPTDTFTIVTANSLSGAFSNVASGQRILTADGFGSFQVNYGLGSTFSANSVVLSNFVPVPEPASWALLLLGAPVFACISRRRR